jgi:hypothetical protein
MMLPGGSVFELPCVGVRIVREGELYESAWCSIQESAGCEVG